jgi:hypothetical protein
MPTLTPPGTPLPGRDDLAATRPALTDRAARSARSDKTSESASPGGVAPRHRATGLLTAPERQRLAHVARVAFDRCGAGKAGISFDEWRHEQVEIATDGRATGITSLTRGQYREVQAHFLAIAGDAVKAFRSGQRAGQSHADRDLAFRKLREACESGELDYPSYPEAICRKQFRCDLDALETGKVWFLFYTCTRRARAKIKKASQSDSKAGISTALPKTGDSASDAQNPPGGPGERHV